MSWIGLDIGGANLKVAIDSEQIFSMPFPMWRQPECLESALREVFSLAPQTSNVAVTMTGELADCFADRKTGVAFIVDAVERAADDRRVKFYHTGLQRESTIHDWYDLKTAKSKWLDVAAANWHAIGQFTSRFLQSGSGFLIDMGSTTTDIIPLLDGNVSSTGKTDFDRLRSSELLYIGMQRTPLHSLLDSITLRSQTYGIAREYFATIEDVFLLLGEISPDETKTDTADGRPTTLPFAAQRIARMVGNDAIEQLQPNHDPEIEFDAENFLSAGDLQSIAKQFAGEFIRKLIQSIAHVVNANPLVATQFILSGQGATFVQRIMQSEPMGNLMQAKSIQLLADQLNPAAAHSAAAVAVAKIAALASAKAGCSDVTRATKPTNTTEADRSQCCVRVIKIGGSLLDWNQTPERIRSWLHDQPPMNNVWIVGGGKFVDALRDYDQTSGLPDRTTHWLGLELMSISRKMLAIHFPDWPTIDRGTVHSVRKSNSKNVWLDFASWLRQSNSPDQLPESWSVTSDSCAAFFAAYIGADELVLLKSCEVPSKQNLNDSSEWFRDGIVDAAFADFSQSIAKVRLVNLRQT